MPRTSATRGWSCGNRYLRNSPATGVRPSGRRCRRRCWQHAEALDLDLDDVPGLQQPRWRPGVADAGRGAGGEQVARAQGEGVRDQREGVADGVDHLVGAPVLHGLAVDPGLHAQAVAQVADLGRRDHRAERAGVVAVLAEDPLEVSFWARREVRSLKRRVADDGGQRLVRGGVDQRRADVGDDLALPVQAVLVRRAPAPRRRPRSATASSGRTASGTAAGPGPAKVPSATCLR